MPQGHFAHASIAQAPPVRGERALGWLFVMQPAMGSGFAGRRTATPFRNCLRSVANHGVFGAGLYVAAAAMACV
jgi:hypothetical protein